jgi:hypothetical protein
VRVDRRGGALELRVDGSLASRYVPGRASTGLVWDALASALVWLPPPNAHIVGVELDAGVLRAAQRWLGLDALGVEVVQGDARAFLEHAAERYDAILEDVFVGRGRGVHKPEWLPRPGLELARGRLRRGGVLASNTLDESAEVEGALRELLPATVRIEVEEYDNRILVGGPAGLTGRGLRERARAEPLLEETFPRLAFRTR